MRAFVVRKDHRDSRVRMSLEQLEGRALLSSVPPAAHFQTAYSTNWSGYAAETNLTTPASNAVTSVSGSWTVPTVTGTANAYSSVWVGIDGYASNSVEQLGTEQDTSKSGATQYYAWYEMYPNPSIQITTVPIHPGDSISASVTYGSNGYTLQLQNTTTGKSFSIVKTATAQRSSAEWIVEAPSSVSGVLPLANFGTASFSNASATISGKTGAISNSAWQNTAIDMETQSGSLLDQTSGLTSSGSDFTVTYTGSTSTGGHGHGHGPSHSLALLSTTPSIAQGLAPLAPKPTAPANPPTAQTQIIWAPLPDTLITQATDRDSASGLKHS